MFEFLALLFAVVLGLSVYGMVRFGFNIIFLYILLFSLVIVIWSVAVIREERKKKDDGPVR
jgi:hypothetical protein